MASVVGVAADAAGQQQQISLFRAFPDVGTDAGIGMDHSAARTQRDRHFILLAIDFRPDDVQLPACRIGSGCRHRDAHRRAGSAIHPRVIRHGEHQRERHALPFSLREKVARSDG